MGGARLNCGHGLPPCQGTGARLGEMRVTSGLVTGCFVAAGCGSADPPKNMLKVLRRGPCSAPGFRARSKAQKCVPELLGPIFWSLVSVPESGLIFGPAFGDSLAPRVSPELFGSLAWFPWCGVLSGSLAAAPFSQWFV